MLIALSLSNPTRNELDQWTCVLWEIGGNTINLNFFIWISTPSYFTILKLSENIYFKLMDLRKASWMNYGNLGYTDTLIFMGGERHFSSNVGSLLMNYANYSASVWKQEVQFLQSRTHHALILMDFVLGERRAYSGPTLVKKQTSGSLERINYDLDWNRHGNN